MPRNILHFFLLAVLNGVFSLYLRVETGHQTVNIERRDPYVGYFTRIVFENATCIDAVRIHCLTPLTGAEEIDLLYSHCAEDDDYSVAHYTNSKELFILKAPIWTRQLLVSSRRQLTVLDAQVEACPRGFEPHTTSTVCPPVKHTSRKHRHHRSGPIRGKEVERTRRKRSIESPMKTISKLDSPKLVSSNITVNKDEILRIEPGVRLRFAKNVGMQVYGTLIADGTKEAPIVFERATNARWLGVSLHIDGSARSVLRHVRVEGGEGVTAVGQPAPIIEDVQAEGNTQAFHIDTNATATVVRSSAVDSQQHGFLLSGKGSVSLVDCVSASNFGSGVFISCESAELRGCQANSNHEDGVTTAARETVIVSSVLSGNAVHGLRVISQQRDNSLINVTLTDTNVTGQYFMPGISVEARRRLHFDMRDSHVYDNFNGGISIGGLDESTIHIRHTNFTRQRGAVVSLGGVSDSDVDISNNTFYMNYLNEYALNNSVVRAVVRNGTVFSLCSNVFERNTYQFIVHLADREAYPLLAGEVRVETDGSTADVSVLGNSFHEGLTHGSLAVGVEGARVEANEFRNLMGDCDINSFGSRASAASDLTNNTFNYDEGMNVTTRVCSDLFPSSHHTLDILSPNAIDYGQNDVESMSSHQIESAALSTNDIDISHRFATPFPSEVGEWNPFPPITTEFTHIRNVKRPYTVDSSIVIPPEHSVVVEEGVVLLFAKGAALRVQGNLYLNGSSFSPISLAPQNENERWKGIKVEKDGHLSISHVSVWNATNGLIVDSPHIHTEELSIQRPAVGLRITKNSGLDVDMQGVSIRNATGDSVLVEQRKTDISLSNVWIESARGPAVRFVRPAGRVQLRNVHVRDAVDGISIREDSKTTTRLDKILVSNVTVSTLRPKKVSSKPVGLSLAMKDGEGIDVTGSRFSDNRGTSLVIETKCIPKNKPPLVRVVDNTFENNPGPNIFTLSLGGCGNSEVKGNVFKFNNWEGTGTTMRVDEGARHNGEIVVDKNIFVGNAGQTTVDLAGDNPGKDRRASFTNNFLVDNLNGEPMMRVSSPYKIHHNYLNNTFTMVQLAYSGKNPLDASENYWGSDSEEDARRSIENLNEAPLRISPLVETVDLLNDTMSTMQIDPQSSYAFNPKKTLNEFIAEKPHTDFSTDELVEYQIESTPSLQPSPLSFADQVGGSLSVNYDCSKVAYCSGHGVCINDAQCRCSVGWAGPSCSEMTDCATNCSAHGVCQDTRCVCHAGFSGRYCESPLCLGGCGGHGTCVGRDECKCEDGWGGPVCLDPRCSAASCVHGKCNDKVCACDAGWMGEACDRPLCEGGCGLNGRCTAPSTCSCLADFSGARCEQCSSPSCNACQFECAHGECDETTRSCICLPGWTGAGCDVCETGVCKSHPTIDYILPATGDQSEDQIVTVYGQDLPSGDTKRYTCIYGAKSTQGVWISSRVVRCGVPSGLADGKFVFNIIPTDKLASIQPAQPGRVITYTVQSTCIPSICSGVCTAGVCVCPRGRTAPNCETLLITPSIDSHVVTAQGANSAREGHKYSVLIPLIPASILRLNSTAPGMRLDAAAGRVEWDHPVGSTRPYNVTLISTSLAGDSILSWELAVTPSYSADVDRVAKKGAAVDIEGHIKADSDAEVSSLPVLLLIFRNGEVVDRTVVHSDATGAFHTTYVVPDGDGSQWTVVAQHPGVAMDANAKGTSWTVEGVDIEYRKDMPAAALQQIVEYKINYKGSTPQSDWQVSVLSPNTVSVSNVRQQTTDGKTATVLVEFKGEPFTGELLVLFRSKQGASAVARHTVTSGDRTAHVTSDPEEVVILNTQKVVQVVARFSHLPLQSAVSVDVLPRPTVLQLINTQPSLQDYQAYSEKELRLHFAVYDGDRGNGSINIKYRSDTILTIPYSFSSIQQFPLLVCAKDGSAPIDGSIIQSADIEITVTAGNGEEHKQQAVINGAPVRFVLPQPGFYQVTAVSTAHEPFSKAMQLSPSSPTLDLHLSPSTGSILPVIDGNTLAIGSIHEGYMPAFPQVVFEPGWVRAATLMKFSVLSPQQPNASVVLGEVQSGPLTVRPPSPALSNGESALAQIALAQPTTLPAGCDAILFKVPYVYSSNSSDNAASASLIVGDASKGEETRLCDASSRLVPLAVRTVVQCDCAQAARSRCRAMYRGAAACGAAWARIPDDTVDIQIVSMFALLIADCHAVGVEMEELRQSLECVASLESVCPVATRARVRRSDGPGDLFNKLAPNPFLSVMNAMDLQSVRLAIAFVEFIDRLEALFPSASITFIDRSWFDTFLNATAARSDGGTALSPSEFAKLSANPNALPFLQRYNATAAEWSAGRIRPKEGDGIIPYTTARRLVESADRLKSAARMNYSPDPFTLLHTYTGRVLATAGESRGCVDAHAVIEPGDIDEDTLFSIHVTGRNMRPAALENIRLELDLVRDDDKTQVLRFRIGPFYVAGLQNDQGSSRLLPNATFEAVWKVKAVPDSRLTRTVIYQAIIVLGFGVDGGSSRQRLASQPIRIQPRKSAKVFYFLQPSLRPYHPYTALVSFMNTGYSPVSISVLDTQLAATGEDNKQKVVQLSGMSVEGRPVDPRLSFQLGAVPSGKSRTVAFNITAAEPNARLTTLDMAVALDGEVRKADDVRWFTIHSSSSSPSPDTGLLVSPLGMDAPLFYFRPDNAAIVNVLKIKGQGSSIHNGSTDTHKYTQLSATFLNEEPSGMAGSVWGQVRVPPMPGRFKLLRIREIRAEGPPRTVDASSWVESNDGVAQLNFIDSSASLPQRQFTYELLYGDPNEFSQPSFMQDHIRIPIPPLSVIEDSTPIGQVAAHSPIDSPLTYALYEPGNAGSATVDPTTGELFLTGPPPVDGRELCFTLVATDAHGQSVKVPVVVNFGGPARPCESLSSLDGLTAQLFNGTTTSRPPTTEWEYHSTPTPTDTTHWITPDNSPATVTPLVTPGVEGTTPGGGGTTPNDGDGTTPSIPTPPILITPGEERTTSESGSSMPEGEATTPGGAEGTTGTTGEGEATTTSPGETERPISTENGWTSGGEGTTPGIPTPPILVTPGEEGSTLGGMETTYTPSTGSEGEASTSPGETTGEGEGTTSEGQMTTWEGVTTPNGEGEATTEEVTHSTIFVTPDHSPITIPPTTPMPTTDDGGGGTTSEGGTTGEGTTTGGEEATTKPTEIHTIYPDSSPATLPLTTHSPVTPLPTPSEMPSTEETLSPPIIVPTDSQGNPVTTPFPVTHSPVSTEGTEYTVDHGTTSEGEATTPLTEQPTTEYIYTHSPDSSPPTIESTTPEGITPEEGTTQGGGETTSEGASTPEGEGTTIDGGHTPVIVPSTGGTWTSGEGTTPEGTTASGQGTTEEPHGVSTLRPEEGTKSPTEELVATACRQKGTSNLWALICDLAKTTHNKPPKRV